MTHKGTARRWRRKYEAAIAVVALVLHHNLPRKDNDPDSSGSRILRFGVCGTLWRTGRVCSGHCRAGIGMATLPNIFERRGWSDAIDAGNSPALGCQRPL